MIKTGLMVFAARLIDVSLGTMKLKSMIRGNKLQTCLIAFIEVIVYTLAASQAFKYVSNPVILIFYALGYTAGNYLGIVIDEKMAKGTMMLMIVADSNSWELADRLRAKGFGVTTSKSYGLNGAEKDQLIVVLPRNKYGELKAELEKQELGLYTAILDVKETFSLNPATVRK